MKKLISLAFLLLASPALGQTVQQYGNVTRGHVPSWNSSGVIADGGSSSDSPITSMGVTNNGGAGFCVSSDRASAAGRNQLCFGAQTSGPATISLQNFGTASPQSMQFIVNGAAQGFPTVSPLPVTSGNLACFSTTSGGLKDCGSNPTTVPLTVGTTPISGGTSGRVVFDNAGILGEYAVTGTGNAVLSASPTLTGTPIFSGAITYGGVTLSNSVTGTGSMVLSAGPTFTGSPVLSTPTATSVTIGAGSAITSSGAGGAMVASAFTDTTNASNISSGTLAAARGGAGTINGALKGNGSGVVSQAACADLSNAAASCATDATNASNISSGTLASARLPSLTTLSAQPSDPTGTTSTTLVMSGLGVTTCRWTQASGTRAVLTISGSVANNTSGDASDLALFTGSGSGPAYGAAPTGSRISAIVQYGGGANTNVRFGFSLTGIITSLTPSTTYWLDLAQSAVVGGTANSFSDTCVVQEMP